MDEQNFLEILSAHKVRPTKIRLDVYEVFNNSDFALSHNEVMTILGEDVDKVTVYRTLHTFVEKGLLHEAETDGELTKYALCKPDTCNEVRHTHQHLHFKCTVCLKTICLEEVQIESIPIPPGFTIETFKFLAEGVCDKCSSIVQNQ